MAVLAAVNRVSRHVDESESLTYIEHITLADDEVSFVCFSGPLTSQEEEHACLDHLPASFCSGNRNVERRELSLLIQFFIDL